MPQQIWQPTAAAVGIVPDGPVSVDAEGPAAPAKNDALDEEGDRGAGGPDLLGEVDSLVEVWPRRRVGGDLRGEDSGDASGPQ